MCFGLKEMARMGFRTYEFIGEKETLKNCQKKRFGTYGIGRMVSQSSLLIKGWGYSSPAH